MTGTVRRVFEPSALRRGRLAVSPVFHVDVEDGSVWRFQRKRDAAAFVSAGCVCEGHTRLCSKCHGYVIREPAVAASEEAG